MTFSIRLKRRAQKNLVFRVCHKICTNNWFNSLVVLLILGNTFAMSMDRYPISVKEYTFLENLNYFFFVAFFLEMLIK